MLSRSPLPSSTLQVRRAAVSSPADGRTARSADRLCWGQPEAGTGRIPCPTTPLQAAVGAWHTINASGRGGTIGSSGSSF